MWSVVGTVPCELETKAPSALVGLIITDVHYIQPTNGVEFSQVLTDFLPVGPAPFWERGVDVSTYNSGFVFSSFCLTCVDALWADTYQSRRFPGELTPFPLCSALSVTHNSPTLKSALSDINAAAPVFFRLVLSWNIFLHTFTFTLYTSLYLKWFLVAVI